MQIEKRGISSAHACLGALALALALTAQPARAQSVDSAQAFFIAPNRAKADAAFTLSALSSRYRCNAYFTNAKATLGANRIDISFTVNYFLGVACTLYQQPRGPEVRMPALKAGKYAVYAEEMAPCLSGPLPCKIPIQEEFAGMLTVGDNGSGWFVRPRVVPGDAPIYLEVLNERYGNCSTVFDHDTLIARNGALYASFLVDTSVAKGCAADVHPAGPTFPWPQGLKPARYPLYVTQRAACEFTVPRCIVDPLPPQFMVPADTVAAFAKAATALPQPPADPGARAVLRRGDLVLKLPETGGAWRVDLLAPDGRRLAGWSNVRVTSLRLPAGTGAGLRFVRLQSASGAAWTLPVIAAP